MSGAVPDSGAPMKLGSGNSAMIVAVIVRGEVEVAALTGWEITTHDRITTMHRITNSIRRAFLFINMKVCMMIS